MMMRRKDSYQSIDVGGVVGVVDVSFVVFVFVLFLSTHFQ